HRRVAPPPPRPCRNEHLIRPHIYICMPSNTHLRTSSLGYDHRAAFPSFDRKSPELGQLVRTSWLVERGRVYRGNAAPDRSGSLTSTAVQGSTLLTAGGHWLDGELGFHMSTQLHLAQAPISQLSALRAHPRPSCDPSRVVRLSHRLIGNQIAEY